MKLTPVLLKNWRSDAYGARFYGIVWLYCRPRVNCGNEPIGESPAYYRSRFNQAWT